MATNLYFNLAASDPASALVRSELQTTPAQAPVFTLGDNPEFNVYLTDGAGGIHSDSGDASITPWLGIGNPGATPTGGTFYLGSGTQTSGTVTNAKRYLISDFNAGDDFTNIGASANATGCIFTASGTTPTTWTNGSTLIEITSNIAYDASAATIQTALNLLASITAQGGVTVAASSSTSFVFIVDWVTVGDKEGLTASGAALTPDASAIIATIRAGDSVTIERQMLRLLRQPAALQSSWTSDNDHWNARLSLNTRGLVDLLAGAASASSRLELQLVDGDGNISTVGQVSCLVRNEVVDPAALVPTPSASYLTAAQVNLAFVQNRYAVTGLTGGGTALDGITTGTSAAPTVQTESLVAIEISSTISFYELVTGTDAESSPDVIRPDDYNGSTNARVWKLRATGSASASTYEAISFSAAGNTDVTTVSNAALHCVAATVSTGAGSYTRTVALLTTNASAGDMISIRFAMPASTNPTVQVRNASSGGTLLTTIAGEAGGVPVAASYFYTGSAWVELGAYHVE